MKFPQSKKFLSWYLKEREKQKVSLMILIVQERYGRVLITEKEISQLQLATIGAILVENYDTYVRIENRFRKVNNVYDTVRKEYGIR